jgi:hypothetical protein
VAAEAREHESSEKTSLVALVRTPAMRRGLAAGVGLLVQMK